MMDRGKSYKRNTDKRTFWCTWTLFLLADEEETPKMVTECSRHEGGIAVWASSAQECHDDRTYTCLACLGENG